MAPIADRHCYVLVVTIAILLQAESSYCQVVGEQQAVLSWIAGIKINVGSPTAVQVTSVNIGLTGVATEVIAYSNGNGGYTPIVDQRFGIYSMAGTTFKLHSAGCPGFYKTGSVLASDDEYAAGVACLYIYDAIYGGLGLATTQITLQVNYVTSMPYDCLGSSPPCIGYRSQITAVDAAGATSYVVNGQDVILSKFSSGFLNCGIGGSLCGSVTNVPRSVENLCWADAVWIAPVEILTGSPQKPNGSPTTITVNGLVRTIRISIPSSGTTSVSYEGTYGIIGDGGASYVLGDVSCPYSVQSYVQAYNAPRQPCPPTETCVFVPPNIVVPCLFIFNEVYGGVGMATTQFTVQINFELNVAGPMDWLSSKPTSGVQGSVISITAAGATSYVVNPGAVTMPNFQWYIQNQCQTPFAYGVPY